MTKIGIVENDEKDMALLKNAINGVSAKTKIIRVMPDYEKWLIALDCVVGVLCAAGITWAVFLFKKKDEVENPIEEKKAN